MLAAAQGKPFNTSCIISILSYSTHAVPEYNSVMLFKCTVEYFLFIAEECFDLSKSLIAFHAIVPICN